MFNQRIEEPGRKRRMPRSCGAECDAILASAAQAVAASMRAISEGVRVAGEELVELAHTVKNPMANESDRLLVDSIRRRIADAWRQLIDRYEGRLRASCIAASRSPTFATISSRKPSSASSTACRITTTNANCRRISSRSRRTS